MSVTRQGRASHHPTERLGPAADRPDQDPDVGIVVTRRERPSPPIERDELPLGTFAGEYELKSTLGRGAFGTVYCAVHSVIGKEVAIKVLDGLYPGVEDVERRFLAEARAVNRINHPNIVDIFGFGELESGQKFYVMELLKGETLRAFCRRFGPLPWRMAMDVLRPLGDALDAAHRVGVLHRDLKPANVFLHHHPNGSIVVKLLDFGIAKDLAGQEAGVTRTGNVIGTPAYMAPERWGRCANATASDIYSLGVIAYEMLTGQRPFPGSKPREIRERQRLELPAAPSSLNPLLPLSVDVPLLAMLNKDPAARPSRASEAIAALKHALDGASENPRYTLGAEGPTVVRAQPITRPPTARESARVAVAAVPSVSPAGQRAPTSRSKRALVSATVIAALVAVALTAGWLVRARPLEGEVPVASPRPRASVSRPNPARTVGNTDQPQWVPRSIAAIRLRVVEHQARSQPSKVVPDRKRAVAPAPRRKAAPPASSSKPLSLAAQELEF